MDWNETVERMFARPVTVIDERDKVTIMPDGHNIVTPRRMSEDKATKYCAYKDLW
jgi:hypothetical protein